MPEVAEAELTKKPIPDGAKQVRVTRTEIFREAIQGAEAEAEGSKSETVETCADCDQTFTTAAWDANDGDCPGCDGSSSTAQPAGTSAIEQLLSNLGDSRNTGADEIYFYVIRNPDPVGLKFLTPWNGPGNLSKGIVPFDDALTTPAAIEMAVQNQFGGGRYQIQVVVNKRYKKQWTATIDDAQRTPIEQNGQAIPATTTAPVTTPSGREQLDEAFGIVANIMDMARKLNHNQPALAPANPAIAAPSLSSQITELATVLTAVKSIAGDNNGGGDGRSSVRDWTEGLSELAKGLGLTQVVPQVTHFALSMVAESKRAAAAAEAAKQQNGSAAPAPPTMADHAAPVSTGSGSDRGLTQTGTPNEVADVRPPLPRDTVGESAVSPAESTAADSQLGLDSATEQALMTALEIVIEQMRIYDDLGDEETDELANEECISLAADALEQNVSRETLEPMLMFPAAVIIAQVAMTRPDWHDVAELDTGITFVNDLKEEMRQRAVPELNVAELEQIVGEVPPAEGSRQKAVGSEQGRGPVDVVREDMIPQHADQTPALDSTNAANLPTPNSIITNNSVNTVGGSDRVVPISRPAKKKSK